MYNYKEHLFVNRLFRILTYLVYSFVLLELISSLFMLTTPGKKMLIGLGKINCDIHWRMRWELQQKEKIKQNYYAYDIYDSHRGWALKPNMVNVQMNEDKIINSNSKGIRGTTEYQYGKAKKKRILILGDSFTFGEEVNDNETYSYYLQEMLPFTEVINFGVHGYGHDQMLIYFMEEGIKYKPDIVVLGFVDLDMERNTLKFRDYAKPKYELEEGKLIIKNYPVPSPNTLNNRWFRSRSIDLIDIVHHGLRSKTGLEKGEAEEMTSGILDEMVKQIRGIGALPIFVHLPVGKQIISNKEDTYLYKYCHNRSICYKSVFPYFKEANLLGEKNDITKHWSAREHNIAAKAIKEIINRDPIINK